MMIEVCNIVKHQASKQNIEIISKVDKNLKTNISKNSIGIILLNIITNSIEALKNGGTIEINWQKDRDDMSLLTIQDNGSGIPLNIRDKIFKPFYTTKENGSGLGLFTVYKIVYLSGGHMHLNNEKKTTFRIYIPIQKDF